MDRRLQRGRLARAQRESLTETLRLDYEVLRVGSWDVPFLNQLLINQQALVRALSDEFQQIGFS